MGRFTVCIPVYNGADYIDQALASIAEQTLEDVDVLVSDNASTDATADVLDQWKGRLNLRVVRQAKTLTMIEHFNAVLDLIDSEFYMLLCHDDYLADPQALSLVQSVLSENPDVGTVYCDLEYVNAQRKRLAGRSFKRKGRFDAWQAGVETIRTARNQFGIPVGVRRTALGDIRYDPTYHYVTDVDLSWAIAKNSAVYHIDKPLITNRYSGNNATWALLSKAKQEFISLAGKYDVRMNSWDRLRFSGVNFIVMQQKRVFGLYGRLVSGLG
jgi:glycosyltransferase involved in cell wall biosynthesis